MWSPPNFSRKASARTMATMASPMTPQVGLVEARAEGHALHRVHAHHGCSEARAQLAVPLDVGPQADGGAGCDDLDDAAHAIAGRTGRVDGGEHPLCRCGAGATHGRLL